ncbi:MAG: hypothetical protein RLZZ524_2350 [Pseudomonadota bacterium]|jgi:hypothetical protein
MQRCTVCQHDPAKRNNEFSECSHPDCPHRRKSWSERPEHYRARETFTNPLDEHFDKEPHEEPQNPAR